MNCFRRNLNFGGGSNIYDKDLFYSGFGEAVSSIELVLLVRGYLGGGNSNIFLVFIPSWGDDPI